MKLLILLFISLFFASCGKESETTIENEITPLDTNAIVFTPADAQGNLISMRKIKPLNGMGNGPLYVYRDGRFMYDWSETFRDLNVPIIRFHDVEYFNAGNEAVNISAIFPDGEADAALESSYNFEATDQLMKAAVATGARIIFRLGENILNFASATGSNTPPTDFDKWAHVAERIVAHYEDGWNDGYFYKDIMWEVWNEPDVSKCWNGPFETYCEFYKAVWQRIHAQHFGRGDGRFVVRSRCRTVCDICGRAVIGRSFADHMRDDFVVISRIERDDRARFQRTVVGDRLGKNDVARLKSVLHRIGHNDVHPVPENRAVLLVHRRYGDDRKQHDEHRKRHDQNSQDCGQDRKNFFNFIRQIALP